MQTTFNNIIAWIKANILLSVGILIAVVLVFFPKVLRHLFGGRRRVRHHYVGTRRVSARTYYRRPRRSLPRSVGTRRRRTSHGPKKPWQIRGSRAAKLHMAKIRRLR